MHNRPISARRCTRPFLRLSAVLFALATITSCSSTQPAYLFRPATSATGQLVVATETQQIQEPVAVVAPATASVVHPAPPRHFAKPALAQHQVRQLRRAVAKTIVQQQAKVVAFRSAAQNTQRVARPQRPTEVGLGTTVLGVLGLVVLPISLVGLLIWGGPVWAVLAGLAALAVLIAYLDPFS